MGLERNTTKSETAAIGALKVVQAAVCGMKWIDLGNSSYSYQNLSYNQKIKEEENVYNMVSNIQDVLTLWRIKSLTVEGTMVVFKTLAIWIIVFLALLIKITCHVVKELFFFGKIL